MAFAGAEPLEFIGHQRIGDVHDIQRHPAIAESIRQAETFQGPDGGIVQTALQDQADVLEVAGKHLVELVLGDVLDRRGQAAPHLVLFLVEDQRRQDDAVQLPRRHHRAVRGIRRRHVVPGDELAGDMAGADAHHQEQRGVAGFRQGEAVLDHVDDMGQVGPGVQQPHLGFHGEGVGALLHDAGTLAVILPHHHHGAAGDAAGRQVGQGVAGHVGAHGGFPGDGAAQRVVDGGRQHAGRGGLAAALLEMHPQFPQDLLGVGQHVHQVGDG